MDAVIGGDDYTCDACQRQVHIEIVASGVHHEENAYVVNLGITADSHAVVDFHADRRCVA